MSVTRTGLLRAMFVGALYCLVSALTLALTRFDGGVSFIWAANALLLAELNHAPKDRWPALLACCGIGIQVSIAILGLGSWSATFMTILNLAEASIGALLLRRLGVPSDELGSMRRVVLFVLVSGALVPAAIAFGAAAIVHAATGTGYWNNWTHWVVAHGLGTVIFTPIISLVAGGELRRWAAGAGGRGRLEAAGLMLVIFVVSVGVFSQIGRPLLFLPMLPMMLAAFRLGFVGVAASTAILSVVSGYFTVRGYGPIQLIHAHLGAQASFLQFYLATNVVMALPVAATLRTQQALFLRLRESEARYRLIAERSSDVILNIRATGEMSFVSPSVTDMYGHDPAALLGRMAGEFVAAGDVGAALRGHAQAMEHPDETHIAEYRIRTADGSERWCEAHMRAVRGEDGQVASVVNSLRDISHRKALETELLTVARTDPLTGIANRRAFSEVLRRRIADVERGVGPGCCAVFDLDFFKTVNDRHGHEAGDLALIAFAAAARDAVRQNDVVARIGGEEFAIILSGIDLAAAAAVCERLRERIAGLRIPIPCGQAIRLTVSVGIVEIVGETDEATILRRADAALYRAKSAGRNRLMLAS